MDCAFSCCFLNSWDAGWLPLPPSVFAFFSHYPIVTPQHLTPSDTQGCALLIEFPALIHFILPFPVQPIGQNLLLSSVTSFASLGILLVLICFPLCTLLPVGWVKHKPRGSKALLSHSAFISSVTAAFHSSWDTAFAQGLVENSTISAVSEFISVFGGAQSFETPECLQSHFRVWSSSLLVQFACS